MACRLSARYEVASTDATIASKSESLGQNPRSDGDFGRHAKRIVQQTPPKPVGTDKEVVKSMGGWNSDKALKPYLDVALPKDIQNELARQNLVEVDVPTPPRSKELASLYEEVHEIRDLLKISQILENNDITVEQLKRAEEHLDPDELDKGNPEPKPTSLDNFSVIEPATAAMAFAGGVISDTLDAAHAPTSTNPPAPHIAETATISAIGVLFVIYAAGTAGLSTAAASAAVYGGMIPVATAKTWWDALRGG